MVVNGNAKSVTEEVISTLDQILKGGDLFVSRQLSEAPEIAERLVEGGYQTVLTGGGDGTFTVMVTEVVRAARAKGRPLPRFGLLKLGTGNALAWVVGASSIGPKTRAADIEKLHQEARSREIRLVDVEGFLTPFAGAGADAQILADYNATKQLLSRTPLKPYAAGLLGYGLAAMTRSLPKYLVREMPFFRVVNAGAPAQRIGEGGLQLGSPIPSGEVLFEGQARIVGISTIPFYGFAFKMFPFANLRSDRMHLRISSIGSVRFAQNVRSIWNGSFHRPDELNDFLVEAVRVECDPPTEFQIGGDPHGCRSRFEARVSPFPIQLVDHYASHEIARTPSASPP